MPKYKYGLKKDPCDLRDLIYFSKTVKDHAALPKTVDLRDKMSSIVDQGRLGSCTANAIVSGLREYLEINAGESFVSLSRLFLYYEERLLEGTVGEDAGASLRDGMKVLYKMGVCPEDDYPYDISKFTDPPSKKALIHALNYRISNYHRIDDLIGLKVALAEGNPIVFGFKVYESFESDRVAQTGKIPAPKSGEELLGGHAVLAVGYVNTSAKRGYVIVRNSWGESWGDHGYCYMPYSVFKKLVLDMWTGK